MLLPAGIWEQVILCDFFFFTTGLCISEIMMADEGPSRQAVCTGVIPRACDAESILTVLNIHPHFKLGSSNEAEG